MKTKLFYFILFMFCSFGLLAQTVSSMKASSVGKAIYMKEIPAFSKMKNIISAKGLAHDAPAKRRGSNTYVPGKGYPQGKDPFFNEASQKSASKMATSAPVASFDAHVGDRLIDATGAIGPNHYVYAFNSGFGILDRAGNVLLPEASLTTLFPGESLGDPIVLYDNFADRFIIMEFSNTPNGFLIAVGQGPDPINDGWFTYRFNTNEFPDYEKISIWSDGYYISANKAADGPIGQFEVFYAVERDKMLIGDASAQLVGFQLPGAESSNFYSPAGFNATGSTLPPVGTGCSIIYLQDDGWAGVSQDELKIWTTTVDWTTPANSSISAPQSIATAPFDSVFDEGSFNNLDEPGAGPDIDALQGAMMYMTNYRRFGTHNSVVMNFVVDLDGTDSLAGIRWYELRQTGDGAPWAIYQEGTYVQPDGLSAFCGSIAQDAQGNIGLGYTVVSSSVFTSLRYTGRLSNDPLNTMTAAEQVSADGDAQNNRGDGRYGDYGQMTIDPIDDMTFWHISEYMKGPSPNVRRSHVVAFKIEPAIVDNEAPSDPVNLVASNTTARQTRLSWDASADNVGVAGYDIYQDGVVVATAPDSIFTVTGLAPLTTYTFFVIAKDASGNESAASNTVSITTLVSTTGPGCLNGLLTPYNESFESDLGAWTQASGNDLDWIINASGTLSNSTGPLSADDGSNYIYVEASGNGTGFPSKRAILNSPCFDLNDSTEAIFSFRYHMFGSSDFGSLDVEASNDEGVTWTSIWTRSGNQGNSWQTATIDLAVYIGSGLQLRFNRLTGGTWQADAAIDAVSLTASGSGGNCATGDLSLSITFDNYPQETSWTLVDAGGTTVASESYSTTNPDGSTVTETITGLASGSYTFTISDSFGDGICCGFGNGSYTLSSSANTIASGGEFGSSDVNEFCVQEFVRLDTYELTDIKKNDQSFILSPNPVNNGILNISVGKTSIQNLEIFSMFGQLVRSVDDKGTKQKVDVSNLPSGTYFARITGKEIVVTRQFVIANRK